jgi:hypothetical protein
MKNYWNISTSHLQESHNVLEFLLLFLNNVRWKNELCYSGVQRINNVFHIVDKVQNQVIYEWIFDLIDIVEYVVYALYSSIGNFLHLLVSYRFEVIDEMLVADGNLECMRGTYRFVKCCSWLGSYKVSRVFLPRNCF